MFGIVLTLISQISLVFSLSCLDSEWGVIVSTIEPFETNGTGRIDLPMISKFHIILKSSNRSVYWCGSKRYGILLLS